MPGCWAIGMVLDGQDDVDDWKGGMGGRIQHHIRGHPLSRILGLSDYEYGPVFDLTTMVGMILREQENGRNIWRDNRVEKSAL